MDAVPFTKMSGSGNDFILIDHRDQRLDEGSLAAFVVGVCRRRLSVGADGVILVERSEAADFRWRFFNADGSPAAMCGNGARCAARFAVLQGVCGPVCRFETGAGVIEAVVDGRRVRARLTDPGELQESVRLDLAGGSATVSCIDTGVPHAVLVVGDVAQVDVAAVGREIRFHPHFAPAGTNADIISAEPGGIAIRTYERGVEAETLACGTGAAAGALVAARRLGLPSPVRVRTAGGEALTVFFEERAGRFREVHQEGEARLVYSGVVHPEAWR
ncbi:MAG TPA: diaminopimelate epimerase [Desulfobacterales bacterium]|nr:diaminopimelate epimerase [Desulfobacterales bacterium]